MTAHAELDFGLTSEIPDLHGVLAGLRREAPVVRAGDTHLFPMTVITKLCLGLGWHVKRRPLLSTCCSNARSVCGSTTSMLRDRAQVMPA
jgi:hypothetical protein